MSPQCTYQVEKPLNGLDAIPKRSEDGPMLVKSPISEPPADNAVTTWTPIYKFKRNTLSLAIAAYLRPNSAMTSNDKSNSCANNIQKLKSSKTLVAAQFQKKRLACHFGTRNARRLHPTGGCPPWPIGKIRIRTHQTDYWAPRWRTRGSRPNCLFARTRTYQRLAQYPSRLLLSNARTAQLPKAN